MSVQTPGAACPPSHAALAIVFAAAVVLLPAPAPAQQRGGRPGDAAESTAPVPEGGPVREHLLGRATRSSRLPSIGNQAPTADESVARTRAAVPETDFRALPYDEDYTYLADPARRTGLWERLKYVPFGGDAWLTLGGEARLRYQFLRNEGWGTARRSDGEFQQRYRLWADAHLGGYARGFLELQSGITWGRQDRAPLSPADDNQPVDLHQAFVDTATGLGADGALALRVGRQEIALGEQRLVGLRDGSNARRAFDGARLFGTLGAWDTGALVARPVEDRRRAFDDRTDDESLLWGGYAVRALALPGGIGSGTIGALYLGLRRDDVRFDRTPQGDETRHTLSIRAAGGAAAWDYDLEAAGQWGRFAGRGIRAWRVVANAGRALAPLPGKPRLGVRFDASSGDAGGPGDRRLGTFNPLFARPATLNGEIGPPNVVELTPNLVLRPAPGVSAEVGWSALWRQSADDGIYTAGAGLIRSGAGSRARRIGGRATVSVRWWASPFVELGFYANHFQAGRFIAETGPARDLLYVATFATVRF